MNLFEMFEEESKQLTFIDALRDFLPVVVKHLDLDHVPKIKLKKQVQGKHLPTFGTFNNDDSTIELTLTNRHPNDILRTLAHELVHYKQNILGQLDSDSWKTGSDAEDQANSEAGVIMRLFNSEYPQYLLLPAVTIPDQLEEKRKRKKKSKARSYGGYYGYYYGGTNTDSGEGGGDGGGGESVQESIGKSTLVGVLAAALSMVSSSAQAEPSDAAKALGIYRTVNRYKDYNGAALEGEATQELNNILRAIQGHPNQSKLLPIIKKMITSDDNGTAPTNAEDLPPLTIDEAHDEPEDQPGMQSTPSDPIPFPKGTTLVNVSDVYDWYKLGMAVSDLDDADPKTFNKGVPHTVFAFGSEEEEHKMMPLLKRLGFSLHDIDNPQDYAKAIRADEAIAFLETYTNENS